MSDQAIGTRRVYHVDHAGLTLLRTYRRALSRALDGFAPRPASQPTTRVRGRQRSQAVTGVTGTTVARAVEVDAVVERAFDVFTHLTGCRQASHRPPAREVVIEPAVGGACYQVGVDGSRCDWGRVMVWDPPWRLQIAWHLNSRFEFDPDADRASEVEVCFTALADCRSS